MLQINEDRETVSIQVTVQIPIIIANGFAKAITGNDDDILLAAETAMRERLEDVPHIGAYGDPSTETQIQVEQVELSFSEPDEGALREELLHTRPR